MPTEGTETGGGRTPFGEGGKLSPPPAVPTAAADPEAAKEIHHRQS